MASIVAEAHRDRKRRATPFTPRDFMPDPPPAPAQQQPRTPDQWVAIMEQLNAMFGGRDLRRKAGDED